jgi:HTH-type transcriptional regulator / antitoxin HigA
MNENKLKKKLLSPPGDTIQETIDKIGMNQYELAERLGKNIKNVNQIIKGKEPITSATALALEKVLVIPADFWLERERQYRKELVQIEFDEHLEEYTEWIKPFPFNAMEKLGWITAYKNKLDRIKELLKFFGVASPRQWKSLYTTETANVTFKISLAHTNEPEAISVWLRKGELDAKNITVKEYNKDLFRTNLEKIKEISYNHPKDFKEQLQQLCADAGVAVVYTPNIPKATICGAARWIFNTTIPLIQLSGRYKTNDHFWFTFFHEAGHILLHRKKDVFLEHVEGLKIDKAKEVEADEFAKKWLLTDEQVEEIKKDLPITEAKILKYSNKFLTHPAIIVGRLERESNIYGRFRHLKIKLDL